MVNKKNLFTIFGFKLVWLSCILGEIYINSLFGFLVGGLFIFFFLIFNDKKNFSIKIILFYSLAGYSFDSLLSYFELYTIDAKTSFIFLPLWFLVLWPSFACLLIDVLVFLKNKKIFSTILGAIIGPLSYYAGISSGLASISNIVVLLLISFFWSLMMFVYSKFN